MVGHAGNLAIPQFKKRADSQIISLSAGYWQAVIRGEVFAAYKKLGCGAVLLVAGKDNKFFDRFPVTAIHALKECTKGFFSGLSGTLVNLVDDVIGEHGEKRFAVAGIEGGVIVLNQRFHGREF